MSRSYVDNSINRSLGRVGMPVGSMPVSRGSSSGGGISSGSGGGGSGGISSGSGGGGSSRNSVFSSSSGTQNMSRSYVDNSMNRSLGRVDMPVGSMPVSRGSSSGGGISSGSAGGGSSRNSGISSNSGTTSTPKTYVDNAMNRRLDRVGEPRGSMPVSKGASGSQSSERGRVYADNDFNRRHERAGKPMGSAVISKSSSSMGSKDDGHQTGTYVDNEYNRRRGRVGEPKGSKPVSKLSGVVSSTSGQSHDGVEVYKDNPFNQKLGRVGKPKGSMVYNKATKTTTEKLYKDTKYNRDRGRVGKPLGSLPSKKINKTTADIKEILDWLQGYKPPPIVDVYYNDVFSQAEGKHNRILAEQEWMDITGSKQPPKLSDNARENFKGAIIPYEELELGKKIGCGGFGKVYVAKWNGMVVAVKKLLQSKISSKRLLAFKDEAMRFSSLEHENIVTFIGVCLEMPNLCIVMEYMQMSLYDAIHIRTDEMQLSESQRLDVIRQICNGLMYLHFNYIAHCDMKTENVLLDVDKGQIVAKINDFGLSMIKSNTLTSCSAAKENVSNIGTPRYSAPEVLRGEKLEADDMMNADVYSLALIVYEVIYEDEPYYNFTYQQLQKQVGERGEKPEFPDIPEVNRNVRDFITTALSFKPGKRPSAEEMLEFFTSECALYGA